MSDLSRNIRRGNSLIRDPAVHEQAMDWTTTFPAVFGLKAPEPIPPPRPAGCMPPPYREKQPDPEPVALPVPGHGFDAVIGNPPWEQVMVHDREFFSVSAPEIATAVSAAERRRLIVSLETDNPLLFGRYREAEDSAAAALKYFRTCGDFPLTGRGRTNTYMVFAELARNLADANGRIGVLVPSAIAMDDTTKDFFADINDKQSLIALYDFENKLGIFPDVHRSYKFCVLLLGGSNLKTKESRFIFFAHTMEDLLQRERQILLSSRDLKLLNPNTNTCPIFRNRTDAELTKKIYRRIPVLVDKKRRQGGNPWNARFMQGLFNQTTHAESFLMADALTAAGFKFQENWWRKGSKTYLPLYEAKMFRPYDHRFGSVFVRRENWMNQGQTHETSLVEHQNPEFVVQPRWWVSEEEVAGRLKNQKPPAFLAFRDITRSTDSRTMIAAYLPYSAVVNTAPILLFDEHTTIRQQCCLLGNLNSLVYDFVVKQKVGHIHLNFFIVEQLPTLPPDTYDDKCPWDKKKTLEAWISERVLKLTCTANDMRPLAEAAGFAPGVWKWKENERAQLRAELDAAYFHLYQLTREDVEYILTTFQGIADEDHKAEGTGMTRRLILEAFDQMTV